jgi:hypothetical protein
MTNPPSCPDSAPQCPEVPVLTREKRTLETARRFANDTTSDDASLGTTAAMPTLAGNPAATSRTPGSGAPSKGLQRGHTTLRHSQFERELLSHPDNAWTSWLLNAIEEGVPLGTQVQRAQAKHGTSLLLSYTLTSCQQKSPENVTWAGSLAHLKHPPPSLKCSGVGVVPKKNGKWRMIYHLSAPRGQSINDFIDPRQYTLHYTSVDDAIRCIGKYREPSWPNLI